LRFSTPSRVSGTTAETMRDSERSISGRYGASGGPVAAEASARPSRKYRMLMRALRDAWVLAGEEDGAA
jgi:hypothetical protein